MTTPLVSPLSGAQYAALKIRKAGDPLMTRAQRETFEAVRVAQRMHRCHCELRAGMTRVELDAMGAGCKDPYYVCPALDAYRRRMPHEPTPA